MDMNQLMILCRKASLSMQKSLLLVSMARDEIAEYLGYEDSNDYEENVSEDWSDWFIDTVEYGQGKFSMDDLTKVLSELNWKIDRKEELKEAE